MKKISIALGLLSLMSLNAWAQPGSPRVSTPAPTPMPQSRTPETNPSPQPNTARRPPILTGGANPTPTPPISETTDVDTPEEDEVIRVETNLVTMPVSVLDRDGRFISGLRQEDFKIFEDGAEQKIEYFASIEQPFTVVLLIDVSPSTQYQINEIQDAAIAFVNQLRRDDRVIVMSFNEQVRILSQATNNRTVLRDAIVRGLDFGEGTSLYDAVDQAINQQLRNIQGRKAVVLFSDGVDTTSQRASYTGTIKQAEELDALIYTIRYDTYNDMGGGGGGGGYPPPRRRGGWGAVLGTILGGGDPGGGYPPAGGGAGSSRASHEAGRRYMEELARNSGGRSFMAQTTYNLESAFSGIAEELRRQYSVGYYPENPGAAGQRKQIRVRVERPGAVVRTKNTYIVGVNGANAKQQTPARPTIRNTGRLPF